MEILCPTCRQVIPAEDINIKLAIAKCASCSTVFNFGGQVGSPEQTRRQRARVPMPKGIKVDESGPDLVIRRSWWTPVAIFLLFFCGTWDAFLVFWYFIAFTQHGPWIMIVFPVVHVAVGVGLTYSVLCYFLNSTSITVRGGVLKIRHGPLPWRGNCEILEADIDQIYCKLKERHGRRGTQTTYEDNAVLTDNRKVTLLASLEDEDQALFIEQALEEHVGITDRQVRGEFRRDWR